MEKFNDLELIKLSRTSLQRTMNEIRDRASSILLLNLKWKDMEDVLDSAQSSVEERLKEVISKEDEIKRKEVEFGLKERDLEQRCRDVKERFRELELMEESLKTQCEELKEKEEQYRLRMIDLEQRSKDFELKEKCLELKEEEIEELSAENRRKYEQQSIELDLKVKLCDQRFIDLESKEKKLAEWSKELEWKKSLAGSLSFTFSIDHSSPTHLWFCANMDGKDLQMFLNECWKEHGSIATEEVAMVLRLSADPAKLVLDAMEGFYPPHLSKGDGEFEGNVIRRSCLLLLEQLMKLSPEIKLDVRQEAIKLASDWITKMKVESNRELEVLGFLYLLASFQLAGAFDPDELVNILVFVAQHIQTHELFKVLGLVDKITGFLQKLVEKKQHMDAIRFIYSFELANEFPLVPVLIDFLKHSETEAGRILEQGKNTPEAQNEANTKRIADVRAVVKCIEDHKLESEYLPHNVNKLKDFIVSVTSPKCNTPPRQRVGIKRPRDAHLGAMSAGFSKKMAFKHPKGSKQDCLKPRRSPRNLSRKENPPVDEMCSHEMDGSSIGVTKSSSVSSHMSSARKTSKFECYNFKREKSEDKFRVDQIWALCSSDGMPKEYAQVKKIGSTPDFKLHVALLEVCSCPKVLKNRHLCCGTFKVNCRQTKAVSCNVVSHRLRAEPIGKDRYAIYPRKGEVWAVYKSWDSEGECDIVEVGEDDEKCKKVVVLASVDVSKSLYRAPRSLRSVAAGVVEIPEIEFARFSHQIPAFRHTGEGSRWRGYWELDPSTIPDVSSLK